MTRKPFVLVIAFLAMHSYLYSQKIDYSQTHSKIDFVSGDSLIQFKIMLEGTPRKVNLDLTYYSYNNFKLYSTKGGFRGNLLDGGYQVIYEDEVIETGAMKKGLKDGQWIARYPDGSINQLNQYKKGRKHGRSKAFSRNGKVIVYGQYKKGLMHGEQIELKRGRMVPSYYKKGTFAPDMDKSIFFKSRSFVFSIWDKEEKEKRRIRNESKPKDLKTQTKDKSKQKKTESASSAKQNKNNKKEPKQKGKSQKKGPKKGGTESASKEKTSNKSKDQKKVKNKENG